MTPQSGFSVQRLRTRPQFQAVLAGHVLAKTAHFAMHCCSLKPSEVEKAGLLSLFPCDSAWLGAMVPKRWAKRAVTRNTIRRQVYCVGSDFKQFLDGKAHVVRLRSAFAKTEYVSASSDVLKRDVRAELTELFSRAKRA